MYDGNRQPIEGGSDVQLDNLALLEHLKNVVLTSTNKMQFSSEKVAVGP